MLPIDLALCMISQAGLFGFYGYRVSAEQHVHIMMACGQQIYVYAYEWTNQSVSIILLHRWQGTKCQSVVPLFRNDAAGCFRTFYNIICICYFHTFKVKIQQQKTRTWPAPRYININWW